MQWINVKERSPAKPGYYTVVTKPVRGKWSQRYTSQMYFSAASVDWSPQYCQSAPIYWLEEGALPGPTTKKRA